MFPFPRTIIGMNPYDMMREMSREMDGFFGSGETRTGETAWYPAVECRRTNGELIVTAELPGLKKEEIKVEVTDDALIIEGERKQEAKTEEDGYFRSERSYGKFYREIALPEGTKADQAKAEMANGVLEVKIPVAEVKPKVRQVAVEEGKKK
jgi:HSP20 family protein